MKELSYRLSGLREYTVSAEAGDYDITADILCEDGIDFVSIRYSAKTRTPPPRIQVYFEHPCIDIHGKWHPKCDIYRAVCAGLNSNSAIYSGAPVGGLFSADGENRLTYALSDGINSVSYMFNLTEDTSVWKCNITLFSVESEPVTEYSCTLRIDYRNIRFDRAVREVVCWWKSLPDFKDPLPVHEACRSPLYSTWYSFHQNVCDTEVEAVLDTALPYRVRSVILDDGWQYPEGVENEYCSCGDWEAAPDRFPDMKAHVERVHQKGLAYFLWVSAPFMGKWTKNLERFRGKLLSYNEEQGIGMLDPRYPEVREYIISSLERAVRDFDVDGIKLDFVDSFWPRYEDKDEGDPGRDFATVAHALDRLLSDMRDRLTKIKPVFGIEFRQSYISPRMWRYANMFRAGDCGNDAMMNRVRTLDLRLLVGEGTVHSDMLTWNNCEKAESAALQLASVMYSVPQISVRPENMTEELRRMLYDWLWFWERNSDVILNGRLWVESPECLYSAAGVEKDNFYIATKYSPSAVLPAPEGMPDHIILVNGSARHGVALEMPKGRGHFIGTVWDCMGVERDRHGATCNEVAFFNVPPGGRIELHRA